MADSKDSSSLNRRAFVGSSLAAPALMAASAKRVPGANDRISLGVIGWGSRVNGGLSKDIAQFAGESNVQITAVCEIWRQRREQASAFVTKTMGSAPRQFVHYEELLAMPEIDAVVIATPDHQHCRILTAAIRAGKDAYIEKPLAMDMKELNDAFHVVKQSDRIVQVGHQIRSYPHSASAKAFVESGGLGKILKVEQSRNAYEPYWRPRGRLKVSEEDVDWKAFLMHRKYRPWNAEQFTAWYGHREFSRGPHAGLMVHFVDLVHYVTGAKLPSKVTALGGVYRWKEEQRDAPDSIEVLLEYPEGFLVRYSTIFGTHAGNYFKFFGTRGTIDAERWSWTEPWGLTGEGSGEPDKVQEGMKLPDVPSVPHMKNWFDCLRSRKAPNGPIEAGYASAVCAIMADESYLRGKRMVYDPHKQQISEG